MVNNSENDFAAWLCQKTLMKACVDTSVKITEIEHGRAESWNHINYFSSRKRDLLLTEFSLLNKKIF